MEHAVLRAGASGAVSASGLEGVVVADTRLSHVDGERGELVIAGVRAEELALQGPGPGQFESVVERLLSLAQGHAEQDLAAGLARGRVQAFERVSELSFALRLSDPMDSLIAATAQGSAHEDGIALLGALPVYAAAGARLRAGLLPIAPRAELSHAEDYLAMLGLPTSRARSRALDAYLITVSDHSLNASTFAVRVVASTGVDVMPCVVAGLGALKGPLHGGAPGPVLDMLDATLSVAPSEWLAAELTAGRRIMGMGHRIYRVRDPRASVFERVLAELERDPSAGGAVLARLEHARRVEAAAESLLNARHPNRPLRANVEFYTALLLEALGIPRSLFTATFAVGRCGGWIAHIAEQRRAGKLIRPAARYVGPLPS